MRTCTVLMTEANEAIREFETRMPAILSEENMEKWLNPEIQGKHGASVASYVSRADANVPGDAFSG